MGGTPSRRGCQPHVSLAGRHEGSPSLRGANPTEETTSVVTLHDLLWA